MVLVMHEGILQNACLLSSIFLMPFHKMYTPLTIAGGICCQGDQ